MGRIINGAQLYKSNGELRRLKRTVEDYSDVSVITTQYLCAYAYAYDTGLIGTPNFQNLQLVTGTNAMGGMFQGCTGLTGTPNFSNLQTVTNGNSSMNSMFAECTGLTGTISFPNLTTVTGGQPMAYMFQRCTGITGVSFPKLQTIGASSGMMVTMYMFSGCTGLSERLEFPSLQTIGNTTYFMFDQCVNIPSAYFPKLTTFTADTIASIFRYCRGMTEVHFRADLDSTHQGYLTKAALFGGETTTYCHPDLQILFDLTDDD